MPPEAEENGTHEQEVNCSLQRMRCTTKSENARMLIVAGGCSVIYGSQGRKNTPKNRIFIIWKHSSFGNLHSNFDFLIIKKNSGGLAAMLTCNAYFNGSFCISLCYVRIKCNCMRNQ